MNEIAIQDQYDDQAQVCYGCGPKNEQGLQLKSYQRDDKVFAEYTARPQEQGFEGFVYGGLVASLVDCHAMATAANNAKLRLQLEEMPRYVTGALTVNYKKPTPLSKEPIKLVAQVVEYSERKAIVKLEVSVDRVVTAEGDVVAVRIPDSMKI